jgi:hypothetical protein
MLNLAIADQRLARALTIARLVSRVVVQISPVLVRGTTDG